MNILRKSAKMAGFWNLKEEKRPPFLVSVEGAEGVAVLDDGACR
jgi:hypothetical protein